MNAAEIVFAVFAGVTVFITGMFFGGEIEEYRRRKQSACQHLKLRTYCVECHKEITQ